MGGSQAGFDLDRASEMDAWRHLVEVLAALPGKAGSTPAEQGGALAALKSDAKIRLDGIVAGAAAAAGMGLGMFSGLQYVPIMGLEAGGPSMLALLGGMGGMPVAALQGHLGGGEGAGVAAGLTPATIAAMSAAAAAAGYPLHPAPPPGAGALQLPPALVGARPADDAEAHPAKKPRTGVLLWGPGGGFAERVLGRSVEGAGSGRRHVLGVFQVEWNIT